MDDIINKINNAVKKIKSYKDTSAIILFGSYAKKRATKFSDVDLCVIGNFDDYTKALIDSISDELIQISFFDEIPIAVKYRVLAEGKVLYLKNKNLLTNLKSRTISDFLDYRSIADYYYKRVYGWKYRI
jgi:hypothetical protein